MARDRDRSQVADEVAARLRALHRKLAIPGIGCHFRASDANALLLAADLLVQLTWEVSAQATSLEKAERSLLARQLGGMK